MWTAAGSSLKLGSSRTRQEPQSQGAPGSPEQHAREVKERVSYRESKGSESAGASGTRNLVRSGATGGPGRVDVTDGL